MTYLVAALTDRIQAEAAYVALERAKFKMDDVSIVGRGYKSADEIGLIDPLEPARRQMTLMAFWLVPFGFASGFAFSLLSGLDTFQWAGTWGNHILGGVLGAGAGAMGSFLVGGGVGLVLGGGEALQYRNQLDAGGYLVVVQGSERILQEASEILRTFSPRSLQQVNLESST